MVQLTTDELSTLGRALLSSWAARADGRFVLIGGKRYSPPQFEVTYGLAAHVHHVATAALDLLDMDHALVATPLVRVCFEGAITAHWVAQTRSGYMAFVNEELRQRRALAGAMHLAASEVFREAASTVSRSDIDFLDTPLSAQRFEQICRDLTPDGQTAYVLYRSLSHFSHPSVAVVDRYLEASEGASRVTLRVEPEEPDRRSWTHLVVASMVWAGRAVDYMDKGHVRRSELRSAAHRIGVAPELHLSEQAQQREG